MMEQFPYLLEAMYSMEAQYQHTLSFAQNERFFPIPGRNKDENWLHVVNLAGYHGYVPTNYVHAIKCSQAVVCNFVEEVLLSLAKTEEMSQEKVEVIEALKSAKMKLESSPGSPRRSHKKPAPPPPEAVDETVKHIADVQAQLNPKLNTVPYLPTPNLAVVDSQVPINPAEDQKYDAMQETQADLTHLPDFSSLITLNEKKPEAPSELNDSCAENSRTADSAASVAVPSPVTDIQQSKENEASDVSSCDNGSKLAFQLVFAVRDVTNLKYELAKEAVKAVLGTLSSSLSSPTLDLLPLVELSSDFPITDLLTSNDASQLSTLIRNMKIHVARESQQAGHWVVDESEVGSMEETLEKIIALFGNTHPNLSRHFIASEDYELFRDALQLLETRTSWSSRRLLLTFLYECMRLDKACVAQAINSFLPTELIRDTVPGADTERLKIAASLLLGILSTREKLPVTSLAYMGKEFVINVFVLIETHKDERVADDLVGVLIGLNLQYDENNNAVLDALETCGGTCTEITEKLIVLFNRGSDPLVVFEHSQGNGSNSVLLFFLSLFGRQKTAAIFYLNDLEVMFDIVLRFLCDLSPGDNMKTLGLRLLDCMIRNTDYLNRPYRASDFQTCLTGIVADQEELGSAGAQEDSDAALAAAILAKITSLT